MRPFFFLLVFFCVQPAFAADVALLLEHAEDSAWTSLLKSGLEKAARDFGVSCEVIVAAPGPEQTGIFRKAAENSGLVIVASDNLHEILRDNAANYRRVKFGSIDAGIRAANIMSVTFRDEQAAFLAGAVAALLTGQTGIPGINEDLTIGWVSGRDTPAMRSLFNGYAEGAALARPGTRVIQALCESFADKGAAAARTERLLGEGADVIAMAAGAASGDGLEKAAEKNAWTIALDRPDGNARELGAIAKAADRAIYEIVESFAGGKFRAKEIVEYDLGNGGVEFIPGRLIAQGRQTGDIRRRIGELRHEIASGAIRLKSLRQRTLCDCLD